MKLTNVSNPAAFGVEWKDGESTFQLVNSRGTAGIYLGTKCPDRWIQTLVVNPERFGLEGAPRNFGEFLKIARAFVGE